MVDWLGTGTPQLSACGRSSSKSDLALFLWWRQDTKSKTANPDWEKAEHANFSRLSLQSVNVRPAKSQSEWKPETFREKDVKIGVLLFI